MALEDAYNMNEIGLIYRAQPNNKTKHKENFVGAKFKRTISLLLL